ncbi:MAG: D-alanyl-D-alanine carboxypeptidase family protein [bacterium]|nr:D-alanyl-D-alanine carboxypeptidase family protein [bacterium]
MKFKEKEIKILEGILKKFLYKKRQSRKKIILMDYRVFLSSLSPAERKLIRKIQNIDISKYGKKTPFYGTKPVSENLVMIRGQKYKNKTKVNYLPVVFLPKSVYQAFKKMNQSLKKETGKLLLINSGYRSPAYQMLILLHILKKNDWKIKKTVKDVVLPGYSEHGYPQKQAIDFTTAGILKKKNKDFSQTKEYQWLEKNASKFGFYLSFPKNNKVGVKFEPWHWRYEK